MKRTLPMLLAVALLSSVCLCGCNSKHASPSRVVTFSGAKPSENQAAPQATMPNMAAPKVLETPQQHEATVERINTRNAMIHQVMKQHGKKAANASDAGTSGATGATGNSGLKPYVPGTPYIPGQTAPPRKRLIFRPAEAPPHRPRGARLRDRVEIIVLRVIVRSEMAAQEDDESFCAAISLRAGHV